MKMKKIMLLAFLTVGIAANSQEYLTEPSNGFVFPFGSKFSIKLIPTDSVSFDYVVTTFEPFNEIIDTYDNDFHFAEEGEEGTLDFYFCFSTSGETEAERDENYRIVLLVKNRTNFDLDYRTDIQVQEGVEFEETSNVGIHAGVKVTEMWPYMIYNIALYEFSLMREAELEEEVSVY